MRTIITRPGFSLAVIVAIGLGAQPAWAQECTSDARRVVDAIYQQVLERGSSGEGAEKVNQLTQGQTTVRDIVREFARSAEHRQRFLPGGGQTAAENAAGYLYRHVLGRQADPEGQRAYATAISRGNIDAVIDELVNSAEYQRNFGSDVVPGKSVRYCPGASSSSAARPAIRFARMDTNRNGTIERAEWDGTPESFNVHDWNRDGALSGDEVRLGGRRALAGETDFDPMVTGEWSLANFRQIDRNDDNRIAANEWYYSPEYFRRADWNRDGWLSAGEFTEFSRDDDRDDQFENLDVNRNGRVERREWHGSADAFDWLDRNRDSVLSREEVVGTAADTKSFDSFNGLDANNNGRIEPSEWRWSRRSFDLSDTNGDGILTRLEFAGRNTTAR